MIDHRLVYSSAADDYDRLVSAEDADDRLGPAIALVLPLAGADVLEVGVGTGRITRILLDRGARVVGCEPAEAMREVATRRLGDRFDLRPVGIEDLEVAPASFDLAIAGWVLGHFVSWYESRWREAIGAALDRMERALRPAGAIVIIETLGTGETHPRAPDSGLREYYAWLENERDFTRYVIRTDYRFDDVETAATVTGRFFGPAFADRVRREQWLTIPECTGLWIKHMGPTTLLREYVERHNLGVRTGSFDSMFELFADDAQMVFEGIPFGPLVGRDAIRSGFAAQPPSDELVVRSIEPTADEAVAEYAWKAVPTHRAGSIIMTSAGGRITRLLVRALPVRSRHRR